MIQMQIEGLVIIKSSALKKKKKSELCRNFKSGGLSFRITDPKLQLGTEPDLEENQYLLLMQKGDMDGEIRNSMHG